MDFSLLNYELFGLLVSIHKICLAMFLVDNFPRLSQIDRCLMAGLEDTLEILLDGINILICLGYKGILTFFSRKKKTLKDSHPDFLLVGQ